MQLLAMAQEDAERRRRKRKKAGLRRWEIDSVSPEAVFTHTAPISTPRLYKLEERPDEYISAVSHLPRPEPVTKPQSVHPPPPDVPPQAIALPDLTHTCVICLDDLAVGHHVRALPCDHVYHAHCIRVWLRRKNACPCCNEKVIKRRKKKPHPTSLAPVHPMRLDDRADTTRVETSQNPLPDKLDASFDRSTSEATVNPDEPTAAELLYQVRRALRGESSTISLNTSVADLEEPHTCQSVPDVPSLACSSLDMEERDDISEPRDGQRLKNLSGMLDPLSIEEKPDETVIDLESTASTEYITPPPERMFARCEQLSFDSS